MTLSKRTLRKFSVSDWPLGLCLKTHVGQCARDNPVVKQHYRHEIKYLKITVCEKRSGWC